MRGTSRSAPTIENGVFRADFQREIDVLLDVVGRDLEPDGDPAGYLAHAIGNTPKIVGRVEIWETGGETAGCPWGRPRTSAILAVTLEAGK